ncbi:MAG: hypothetical protein [Microvirus sp.]|nr:MAG: hypothetical protein [Microvirus sp.]
MKEQTYIIDKRIVQRIERCTVMESYRHRFDKTHPSNRLDRYLVHLLWISPTMQVFDTVVYSLTQPQLQYIYVQLLRMQYYEIERTEIRDEVKRLIKFLHNYYLCV